MARRSATFRRPPRPNAAAGLLAAMAELYSGAPPLPPDEAARLEREIARVPYQHAARQGDLALPLPETPEA